MPKQQQTGSSDHRICIPDSTKDMHHPLISLPAMMDSLFGISTPTMKSIIRTTAGTTLTEMMTIGAGTAEWRARQKIQKSSGFASE